MWFCFAAGSAFFAGVTSILAKCGIRRTDSDTATAIRTIVVLIFSWIMVFVTGGFHTISALTAKTMVFLVLSGMATGASWLCYFKALQLGNINKVVPIDKFSTVLTILFAFIILGEDIGVWKGIGIIGIGIGTWFMIEKKQTEEKEEGRGWFIYAVLSAVFASLTSILGKIGITGIDSNLGTAVRTGVVLIMAWLVLAVKKKLDMVKKIERTELKFIILSGFATGASWLCYYRALQDGPASVVVPIDKLSILVTVIFSYFVFGEKMSKKAAAGLVLIVAGTMAMLI